MDSLGDKDKDGMPDVFENTSSGMNVMSSNMKFIVNGQEYNVLENLPLKPAPNTNKPWRSSTRTKTGYRMFWKA